jgi:hypothetical protein
MVLYWLRPWTFAFRHAGLFKGSADSPSSVGRHSGAVTTEIPKAHHRHGAAIWATPMSVVFCALFWKFGALTFGTALASIAISVAGGFGVAAVMYEFMKRKYPS